MAETFIDQGEYAQGKLNCAAAEKVKPGWFFVERAILQLGSTDRFAKEVLVRILDVRGDDGFPIIDLERLEDDGKPVSTGEIVLDPDNGIIMSATWAEGGYLMGGREQGTGPFNFTKAALLAPAVRPKPAQVPLRVMYMPLPKYDQARDALDSNF